jgi:N-acetylglucosamine kinase-like BadF-type ATPase
VRAAREQVAVLAVDGGNSKVDVALVGLDGALLGAARGGGTPFHPELHGVSLRRLLDSVAAACGRAGFDAGARPLARVGAFCLAGDDLPVDDRRITRALRSLGLVDELVLRNDTFAVLRAGSERQWGVGVVCGAGMNCSAVAPNGRVLRFASLGEVSGDEGGGGWLGVRAVRAAVRGRDGRGPHTVLETAVPAHYGVRSILAVLEAIQGGRVGDYPAELAPVVFACATAGDAVARAILDEQADQIIAMAVSAVRRLHLTRRDVEVVLGGGLFRAGDRPFLDHIESGILAVAPAARVKVLGGPPVVGAALLGLDRLAASGSAARRLRSTLTHERLTRAGED